MSSGYSTQTIRTTPFPASFPGKRLNQRSTGITRGPGLAQVWPRLLSVVISLMLAVRCFTFVCAIGEGPEQGQIFLVGSHSNNITATNQAIDYQSTTVSGGQNVPPPEHRTGLRINQPMCKIIPQSQHCIYRYDSIFPDYGWKAYSRGIPGAFLPRATQKGAYGGTCITRLHGLGGEKALDKSVIIQILK